MIRPITTNRRRLPIMGGLIKGGVVFERFLGTGGSSAVASQRESAPQSSPSQAGRLCDEKQLRFIRKGLGCISVPIREIKKEIPD
jgi:hypothetical protein